MKPSEIARLLPQVFRQTMTTPANPLSALVEVMSALHAPSEAALEDVDAFFDPLRTPDRFVPFLAAWMDLDRLFDEPFRVSGGKKGSPLPTGLERLRVLTAVAAHLSRWRGTEKGLIAFLEIATGAKGFAIDQPLRETDAQPTPFHIRVIAPGSVRVHRRLIERIVESEKPAYVTWELSFAAAEREGD
jgi:phage tail-like protein